MATKLENVQRMLAAIATYRNPWNDIATEILALSVNSTLKYAIVRIIRTQLANSVETPSQIRASTNHFFEKLDTGDWTELGIDAEEAALLPSLSAVADNLKILIRDYLITRGQQIINAAQSIIDDPDSIDLRDPFYFEGYGYGYDGGVYGYGFGGDTDDDGVIDYWTVFSPL